jgi:hypothetical protein
MLGLRRCGGALPGTIRCFRGGDLAFVALVVDPRAEGCSRSLRAPRPWPEIATPSAPSGVPTSRVKTAGSSRTRFATARRPPLFWETAGGAWGPAPSSASLRAVALRSSPRLESGGPSGALGWCQLGVDRGVLARPPFPLTKRHLADHQLTCRDLLADVVESPPAGHGRSLSGRQSHLHLTRIVPPLGHTHRGKR